LLLLGPVALRERIFSIHSQNDSATRTEASNSLSLRSITRGCSFDDSLRSSSELVNYSRDLVGLILELNSFGSQILHPQICLQSYGQLNLFHLIFRLAIYFDTLYSLPIFVCFVLIGLPRSFSHESPYCTTFFRIFSTDKEKTRLLRP